MKDEKSTIVKCSEFAKIHKVTRATVAEWAKMGMPKIRRGKYDLEAASSWVFDYRARARECSACGNKISIRAQRCRECIEKEKKEKRDAYDKKLRDGAIGKASACGFCGSVFVKKWANQKACSQACGAKMVSVRMRENRTCKACGTIFNCGKKSKKQFCTNSCSTNSQKKYISVSCHRCRAVKVVRPCHLKKQKGPEKRLWADKKHFCTKVCHIEWQKENRRREQATPKKALFHKVRIMIRNAAVLGKETKSFREIFGYSAADLRAWLESKFKPGMSWANYGEWHIDHIIPLSKLNYTCATDPDFIRAWSLKNLQPLWAQENFCKSDNLRRPIQPSLSFGATI